MQTAGLDDLVGHCVGDAGDGIALTHLGSALHENIPGNLRGEACEPVLRCNCT